MEEASISTLCSLLWKVGEHDLEGEKDMVVVGKDRVGDD
jgi:hypothetical protein